MRRYIRDNSFGPFCYNGCEILRRLFVTVRDETWQETPPNTWISTVDDAARTVRVEARHTNSRLDVDWQGTLSLGKGGRSGSFEFEAVTRRTTHICRLGLVVLHPVDFMVGAKITAQSPQGLHSLTIARAIAPQPIVNGIPCAMTPSFSSLLIEREDIGQLRLEFDGDFFELEDQRNWGDASFKTYCTPLSLGFPRTLDAKSRITQRLRWTFSPASPPPRTRERPRVIAIRGMMPSLGCAWTSQAAPSSAHVWHHFNLDLRSKQNPAALGGRLESDPVRTFEIAVSDDVPTSMFSAFVARIVGHRARIARVLVYGTKEPLPSETEVIQWRGALEEAHVGHARLLAATQGYFVEFNRAAPALRYVVDGLAFPHTPTVHSDDAATVTDSVTALRDIADSACSLIQHPTLALAPLALYYPSAPASRSFPLALLGPWFAAKLIHAAAAGLAAITLEDELAQDLPHRLLDVLLQFQGSRVTVLVDEERPKLHLAVLVRDDDRQTLLAVNLDEVPVSVQVERWASCVDPAVLDSYRILARQGELSVPPRSVRWFDSTSYAD